MREYEELVNSLKNCVYIPCDGTQKEKCLAGRENDCKRELMAMAVDAIEELQTRIDRAVGLYNRDVEKTAIYEALIGISPEPPKETTNDS